MCAETFLGFSRFSSTLNYLRLLDFNLLQTSTGLTIPGPSLIYTFSRVVLGHAPLFHISFLCFHKNVSPLEVNNRLSKDLVYTLFYVIIWPENQKYFVRFQNGGSVNFLMWEYLEILQPIYKRETVCLFYWKKCLFFLFFFLLVQRRAAFSTN